MRVFKKDRRNHNNIFYKTMMFNFKKPFQEFLLHPLC